MKINSSHAVCVRIYFFSQRKTARKSPRERGEEGGRKGRCAFLWAIVGGEVVEDKRWIFAGYSAAKACQREFHFVNTIRGGGDTYTQALQKCHRKIRHRFCLFLPRPTTIRRVQYNNTGMEEKEDERGEKEKQKPNKRSPNPVFLPSSAIPSVFPNVLSRIMHTRVHMV